MYLRDFHKNQSFLALHYTVKTSNCGEGERGSEVCSVAKKGAAWLRRVHRGSVAGIVAQ
jgi:hypothetical protein